jgi:SAM-dependent methyltransferase
VEQSMHLWSQFWNHTGRLIHKPKHYLPVYERHLHGFVGRPLTFLEIGCGHGGSLQMWKSYFGPHAEIVGLDIRPECKAYEEDQVNVRIGSQSDSSFLDSVVDEFGPPDIVIDDGSHMMKDIAASFASLYHRLTPNGVYVVEDLNFAYNANSGGGLRRPGTFIEFSKAMVDQLHARYTNGALVPDAFTEQTMSIHFYDSMVVFERGRHAPKVDLHRGTHPRPQPKPALP